LKTQTFEHTPEGNEVHLSVKEVNSFRGIPYSDYFNVLTEWRIKEVVGAGKGGNDKHCAVSIFLDFKFFKSTWLQGTIESNTKAELVEVFDLWNEAVSHQIRQTLDTRQYSVNNLTEMDKLSPTLKADLEKGTTSKQETNERKSPEEEFDEEGKYSIESTIRSIFFLYLFM
jgi:hypothetical protein